VRHNLKSILQKITVQILCGLAVVAALLLPGYLFGLLSGTSLTWFREKYFWMFWGFGLALAGCRSSRFVAAVLVLLGGLELTQFGSLAFSHEYITPFSIGLMLVEFLEVAETAAANSMHFLYVPFVVLLPYALCFFGLYWTRHLRFRGNWPIFVVIAFLFFPLIRIKTHADRADIINFFPTAVNPSLVNSLNSYSLYFGVLFPEKLLGDRPEKVFPPYEIRESDIPSAPATVVLVMGESLTPNHMSLFGYTRQTTPVLESLSKNPSFVANRGYSAANATRSSLPMFYTLQYHPLDEERLRRQDSNLFLLAKRHGFSTYYLSAQNSNCLNGVNLSSIDTMVTYDTRSDLFDREKDEGLLQLIREIKPGGKKFIVVHQRNVHLPYATNTEHRPEFQRYPTTNLTFAEASINAYDNAVLYADYLYGEVIKEVRKKTEGPLYIFFTSDHGEELGENGHWAHDQLDLISPTVPIMFYGEGVADRFIRELRDKPLATHYELGKKIAAVLGYAIGNPGEEENIVYVNGVASLGRSGYLRFRRGEGGKPEDLQIIRAPSASREAAAATGN
jgi:glucan phosphoethanolaminetransferase (alkaline phosphatase superfamily)